MCAGNPIHYQVYVYVCYPTNQNHKGGTEGDGCKILGNE